MMQDDLVRRYYDKHADKEWERHDRQRMEFTISKRLLSTHLPQSGRVLDCGGGPGRYALWLADHGFEVTLFDLSAACLEKARIEARAAGANLVFAQGTATDLSRFADASFDVVLLMGPLYHLKKLASRRRVVDEATHVLKPDGVLATAFITRTAALRFFAKEWADRVLEVYEPMRNLIRQGFDPVFPPPDGGFPAYFAHPTEVEPLLRSGGLAPLGIFAVEGFVSMIDEAINALHGEEWDAWVELNLMLASDPTLFSGAEHLLAFGRKAQ